MKALFVGNKYGWEAMRSSIRPQWDWQYPVLTLDDLMTDKRIADDTAIMVISDEFYLKASKRRDRQLRMNFLRTVYDGASSMLTIIVDYSKDPRAQTLIDQDLSKYASTRQDAMGPYYWAPSQRITGALDSAIRQYINNDRRDDEVAAIVSEAENMTAPKARIVDQSTEDSDIIDGFGAPIEEVYTNNYGRKGLVFANTSSKGGVGKTTITLNNANFLSLSSMEAVRQGMLKKPLKVAVIDMDVKDGQITTVVGQQHGKPKTIMNIATAGHIDQQTIGDNMTVVPRTGVSYLFAPNTPRSATKFNNSIYGQIIDKMRTMFDVIFLDTSVDYSDPLFADVIYPKADRINLIIDLDKSALIGACKWIVFCGSPRSAGGAEIPLSKVGYIVNRGRKDVDLSFKEIVYMFKQATMVAYRQLDKTIPLEQQDVPKMMSAFPDIGEQLITKFKNLNQIEMTLNIPEYQKSMDILSKRILPESISSRLVPIKVK